MRLAGQTPEECQSGRGSDIKRLDVAHPPLSEPLADPVVGGSSLRQRNLSAVQSKGVNEGQVGTRSRGGSLKSAGLTLGSPSGASGPLPEIPLSRAQSQAHRQAEAAELMHVIDGDWGGKGVDPQGRAHSGKLRDTLQGSLGRPSLVTDGKAPMEQDLQADAAGTGKTQELSINNPLSNMEAGLIQGEVFPETGANISESKDVASGDICVDLEWDAGENLKQLLCFHFLFIFILSLLPCSIVFHHSSEMSPFTLLKFHRCYL